MSNTAVYNVHVFFTNGMHEFHAREFQMDHITEELNSDKQFVTLPVTRIDGQNCCHILHHTQVVNKNQIIRIAINEVPNISSDFIVD